MRVGKSRPIIATDDVPCVFDDAKIQELSRLAKLPRDADVTVLGRGVRDAALIFIRHAGQHPKLKRQEIATLWKAAAAAKRPRWKRIAALLETLSPAAREMLNTRGALLSIRTQLPLPDTLLDPERREAARSEITKLCHYGGKRSGSKWKPLLYAPEPVEHPPKREAERDFVMWLRIAWCEAMGTVSGLKDEEKRPAMTARHADDSRDVGPFARLARECLKLVGAGDADVVELINELQTRREAMEPREK